MERVAAKIDVIHQKHKLITDYKRERGSNKQANEYKQNCSTLQNVNYNTEKHPHINWSASSVEIIQYKLYNLPTRNTFQWPQKYTLYENLILLTNISF